MAIKPTSSTKNKASPASTSPKQDFGALESFFILLSGTDFDILKVAIVEKQKYISIGSVVLVTGILAFCTMSLALYDTLKLGILSFPFAIMWALCIIALDRYILASSNYEPDIFKRILGYSPRFIVALLIAFVISEPLLLRIFITEVDKEVKTIQLEERIIRTNENLKNGSYADFKKESNEVESKIKLYRNSFKSSDDKYQKLIDERTKEINGSGGSGRVGFGINAKKLDEAINNELNERNRFQNLISEEEQKRSRLVKLIDSLNLIASTSSAIDISKYDGILVRIDALSRAESKGSILSFAVWLLRLLLISIELTPVLYKLMAKKSIYDEVKEQVEKSKIQLAKEWTDNFNKHMLGLQKIANDHDERLDIMVREEQETLNRKLISAETVVLAKSIAIWESDRLKNIKQEYIKYLEIASIVEPPISSGQNINRQQFDPKNAGVNDQSTKDTNNATGPVVKNPNKNDFQDSNNESLPFKI